MKSQVSLAFIVLLIVSALTATAVTVSVVKTSETTGLDKQQAIDTCNQYCAEEVQLIAQNPSLRYPRIIDFCKWSSDIKGMGYVMSCNGLSQCFIPNKDCYIHCAGSQAVCLPFPYSGNDLNTSINTCNYLCELENEVSNVTQWHDSLYCQWRGTVVGYGNNLTCDDLTSCYLSKYGCNIECNGTMAHCPAINFTEACGNMCELENHWAEMNRTYPHSSLYCSIWSDINGSRTNCTAESSCYVAPYDCYIQCNGHSADCVTPCKTFDVPNTYYKMGGNKAVHSGSGACMKIVADNVTLDCQGNEIIGDGNGIGIEISGDNVTIKNCKVKGFNIGIYGLSNNSKLIGNTFYGSHASIEVSSRQYNVELIGNTFVNGQFHHSNPPPTNLYNATIKNNSFEGSFNFGSLTSSVVTNNSFSHGWMWIGTNNILQGNSFESYSIRPKSNNNFFNNVFINSNINTLYASTYTNESFNFDLSCGYVHSQNISNNDFRNSHLFVLCNTTIAGNNFSGKIPYIKLEHSRNVRVTNNYFEDKLSTSQTGYYVSMEWAHYNLFEGNIFNATHSVNYFISLEGSGNNTFVSNTFVNCGSVFKGNQSENIIGDNTLINCSY
jgi:hypothetical protein